MEDLLRHTDMMMERRTLAGDGSNNIAFFLWMRGLDGKEVEDGVWGKR